jgi:hypothetical protein
MGVIGTVHAFAGISGSTPNVETVANPQAGASVLFGDRLFLTSSALPDGTPVQLRFTIRLDGVLTKEGAVDVSVAAALRTRSPGVADQISVDDAVGATDPNGSKRILLENQVLVNSAVGNAIDFDFTLTASASGLATTSGATISGNADVEDTGRIYIELLTAGAQFAAASGTSYELVVPEPGLILPLTGAILIVMLPSRARGRSN